MSATAAFLPARGFCARRWSSGAATSIGSRNKVRNVKPGGRATGSRRKPQWRLPEAIRSVISAALFPERVSSISGYRPRNTRSTRGVNESAAAKVVDTNRETPAHALRDARHALLRHGHAVEDAPGLFEEQLAALGQRHALWMATKQHHAEIISSALIC